MADASGIPPRVPTTIRKPSDNSSPSIRTRRLHALHYLSREPLRVAKTIRPAARSGMDVTITTSPKTTWLHSDGLTAKKGELLVGSRGGQDEHTDGKTAASVQMNAPVKK